jgi:hypothetical protein
MSDDDLGLSDRDKELKRWNAPYRYQEFPKMLFRGTTTTAGRVEYVSRVVGTVGEEAEAVEAGWRRGPQEAVDAELARGAQIATAAAERAWTERQMSEAAQAEAAAVDAATARHVPEIPETSRRKTRERE